MPVITAIFFSAAPHNIKGFHSRQAQLFREDAHQGGVPFLAGRMTEYCVARAVGPKVLRLRPISILYVLRTEAERQEYEERLKEPREI